MRLDRAVHAAGLAASREKAPALILAGRIRVDGQLRDKPGATVAADATITLTTSERPYVSRGGEKLAGVLAPLAVDPGGLACLDVGSSTGGFTDVLLRAGAARVTAVDVGRGLIDASLRRDPRVELVEGVNARYLLPEQVSPPYDLITVDVSFISLTLVLP
ncbi:MAG: TlyA family RNA methyltransferase, partial [Acidobacteriota bacterium]